METKDKQKVMIEKRTWREFQESGMVFVANIFLQFFGWSLAYNATNDQDDGITCYPVRSKYRGFDEKSNMEGHAAAASWLNMNAAILLSEALEEDEEELSASKINAR